MSRTLVKSTGIANGALLSFDASGDLIGTFSSDPAKGSTRMELT